MKTDFLAGNYKNVWGNKLVIYLSFIYLFSSDAFEKCIWTLQGWAGLWLSMMSGWFWHHLAPTVFVQSFHCQNRRSILGANTIVHLENVCGCRALSKSSSTTNNLTSVSTHRLSSMVQEGLRVCVLFISFVPLCFCGVVFPKQNFLNIYIC